MTVIERYSVARCRDCKAQWQATAPRGRECGACGSGNTGEWVTVPATAQGAVPADDAAVERMVGLLARYGWAREVREALVQDLLNAARGGQ